MFIKHDVKTVCKLYDFLQTEYGYKLTKTEIPKVNDVFLVEYFRESDCRKIRIIRDRGYYELTISVGKSFFSLPLILKYLFPDQVFTLNYQGMLGLRKLVELVKQYYEIVEKNMILLDESKIHHYFIRIR